MPTNICAVPWTVRPRIMTELVLNAWPNRPTCSANNLARPVDSAIEIWPNRQVIKKTTQNAGGEQRGLPIL